MELVVSILDKVLENSAEPPKPEKRKLEEPPHDGKWFLIIKTKNPLITYKYYTDGRGRWTRFPEKGYSSLSWGFLTTYAYKIEVHEVG